MNEPSKCKDEDDDHNYLNDFFKGDKYRSEEESDNKNYCNEEESDNKINIHEEENNNINFINFDDKFENSFYIIFGCPKKGDEETINNGEENIDIKNLEKKKSLIKIHEKRKNKNKITHSNNQKSYSEEVPKNYSCPQENKSSGKQSTKLKDNLDSTTKENTSQKKGNINKPKFSSRKHGRTNDIKDDTSKLRKVHNKFNTDNEITKIKSFALSFLTKFLNQLSEKITKGKQYYLHKICGYQAGHRVVEYDKKLIKKELKIILSDTGDMYNKNIINELCINEDINTFLKLKLEDIFNYLRNKEENRIFENNKIIEKEKDQYIFWFLDSLNLYSLYKSELNKRNKEDKEIIGAQIKEDFVKLINGRKSKNVKKKREKVNNLF